MTNETKDIDTLYQQIIEPFEVDPADEECIKRGIKEVVEWGFSYYDIIRYCQCFEEVNTKISEERALSRMRTISETYPKHPRHKGK